MNVLERVRMKLNWYGLQFRRVSGFPQPWYRIDVKTMLNRSSLTSSTRLLIAITFPEREKPGSRRMAARGKCGSVKKGGKIDKKRRSPRISEQERESEKKSHGEKLYLPYVKLLWDNLRGWGNKKKDERSSRRHDRVQYNNTPGSFTMIATTTSRWDILGRITLENDSRGANRREVSSNCSGTRLGFSSWSTAADATTIDSGFGCPVERG